MQDERKSLVLRPHHALCLQFFTGHGYCGGFVENMFHIKRLLGEKPWQPVVLHCGIDEICAACPNNRDGASKTAEKVAGYDKKCLNACGFSPEETVPWEEVNRRVSEKILRNEGMRQQICSDCLWNSLCQQQDVENSVESV